MPGFKHVRDGEHIFNTTTFDPYGFYVGSRSEVLSTLKKENKIENTTLYPGQTINGSVVFQVNSLYNESFLLTYNETPVSSASFEKSIKALRIAEHYDYSVIFGIPPYNDGDLEAFEPNIMEYPYVYSSWINRSVFEYFKRVDSESVLSSPPDDMHCKERYSLCGWHKTKEEEEKPAGSTVSHKIKVEDEEKRQGTRYGSNPIRY